MTVAATLPLAFVMVAGPQIISSFFFATSEKWKSVSATYVLGAAVSLLAVVTAAYSSPRESRTASATTTRSQRRSTT